MPIFTKKTTTTKQASTKDEDDELASLVRDLSTSPTNNATVKNTSAPVSAAAQAGKLMTLSPLNIDADPSTFSFTGTKPTTTATGQMVVNGPGERTPRNGETAADVTARLNEGQEPNKTNPAAEDSKYDELRAALEELTSGDATEGRSALEEQLRQANTENLQSIRARTGLAGMGLTGAAGAAEGTERRRGARETELALADFDKSARAEEAQRLLDRINAEIGIDNAELSQESAQFGIEQARVNAEREGISFDAALDQLEKENKADYNKDGKIGLFEDTADEGTVDDPAELTEKDKRQEVRDALYAAGKTWDYGLFDDGKGGPGSNQEPYIAFLDERDNLERQGFVFEGPVKQQTGGWSSVDLYIDQDGNYWFFDDRD